MKVPPTVLIGATAACVALTTLGAVEWLGSRASIDAGFWYEGQLPALSPLDTARIDGPLTAGELERIRQISRAEVSRAFSGLRITVTDSANAFWRVAVVSAPPRTASLRRYPFATAGQSHVFGPLGGFGSVGFLVLAHNAIAHAEPSAAREDIVAGIGRGVGRAAVHEFAHQALGVDNWANIDNRTDLTSYEYWNADRTSQYYGELRWGTAWPVLQRKFGK